MHGVNVPGGGPGRAARRRLLLPLLLLAAAASAGAGPRYRVENASVVVLLPMTVGGSFEARTGALTGELEADAGAPGAAAGELQVDLATLDTGIGLRNRHLRENYLEVQKGAGFDRAVLSEIRVEAPELAGFEGKAPFRGTFQLHGVKKEVQGTAEIRRAGGRVHVDATFPLLVSDFAIAKPSYLGVGVKNEIRVKVSFDAAAAAGGAAPERS